MDQILQTIGDTIGDFFENPIVQAGIQLLFAYLVVIWLATSYWAFRDMQQRTANPVAPYLAAAGVILFTPFFFFFGRTRRSARSGSATWRRKLCWPRSSRSTIAPPATVGSTRNGSSARRVARG